MLQLPVLRLYQAGLQEGDVMHHCAQMGIDGSYSSTSVTIRGKTAASASMQASFPESQSYCSSAIEGQRVFQNPDTSLLCLLCRPSLPPSLPPVAKRYPCSPKSLIQTLGCCISLFNLQFKFSDRQKQPSCSLKIARSYIEIQEIANASSSS